MKNAIIVFIVFALVGFGAYFLFMGQGDKPEEKADLTTGAIQQPQESEQTGKTQDEEQGKEGKSVIGKSAQGREITAYHYGDGDAEIIFVGGIHGGYSWNTALVAYETMDYLEANPDAIPGNVMVTVVPALNPDGLNKVVGTVGRFAKADVPSSQELKTSGRFNANNVDLNRNFDCDWQSTGKWQNASVSGGSKAFSELESSAIRDYVEARKPAAVVVWYSAAGGVFASSCHNGILPETSAITKIYSKASGYPAYESFDFYKITGDMVNWLAKKKIPAISVLLSTHEDTDWNKNRAGIEELLKHYAQ